jgi:hypothetical protein
MNEIFQIRHLIVHKRGKIDREAIDKVNRAAQSKYWLESMENKNVTSLLDAGKLKHYVETLEKIARIVIATQTCEHTRDHSQMRT